MRTVVYRASERHLELKVDWIEGRDLAELNAADMVSQHEFHFFFVWNVVFFLCIKPA